MKVMSIVKPELEIVQNANSSIRYLEHGWPDKLCRWHFHKDYELHYIKESNGTTFIGDYIGNFKPNSLFLLGSFLPHNWISDDCKIEIRDMLVQFDADVFNKEILTEFCELENLFQQSLYGIEFIDFDVDECVSYFYEVRQTKGLKRFILTLEFLRKLSVWSKQKTLSLSNFNFKSIGSKTNMIGDSIEYILNNYSKNISLERLANMSNSSKSKYCRHFSKTLGLNFSEFIVRVRIAKACTMLYQTQHSISTICYEVGFRNLSNFNRQFLRLKKITPTLYRRKMDGSLNNTQKSLS